MLQFRKGWVARIIAILIIVFDAPFFSGVDRWIQAVSQARASDPESTIYELNGGSDGAIADLAKSCHYSAFEIFEWVRQHVEYEAYSGSAKGALGSYYSGRANDVDQAMLVAALLKISNVRWRLVSADIKLPLSDALNWLGISNADQASELLKLASVGYTLLPNATTPTDLLLKQHTWVQAYLDYLPTRGAAKDDATTGAQVDSRRDPEEMWVDLDPSVTFRQSIPQQVALAENLGIDSPNLFKAIINASTPVPTEPADAITSIPQNLIDTASRQAGESLRKLLSDKRISLADWLAAPAALQLHNERQGLPGNVPFSVVSSRSTVDGANDAALTSFLEARGRKSITLTLRTDEQGSIFGTEIQLGTARTAGQQLALRFDLVADGILNSYTTQSYVPLQLSNQPVFAKPVISLGGTILTATSGLWANLQFPIGKRIWLDVKQPGQPAQSVPVIVGGQYQIAAVRTLGEDQSARRKQELVDSMSGLTGTDPLTPGAHSGYLSHYIDLAVQSVLLQNERFSRLSSAALGYHAFTNQVVSVAGIEPTVTPNELTSPTLVSHLLGRPGLVVPRVSSPLATREQAFTAAGLISDLALTSAMEPLTGSNAYQSASKIMVLCNGAIGILRTLLRGTSASTLAGKIPAALVNEVASRLQNSSVVLTDPTLSGQSIVGATHEPLGFTAWPIPLSSAALLQQSAWSAAITSVRHGWAPLPALVPADLLTEGAKQHYADLTSRGIDWAEGAWGITLSAEPGVAAAAGILYSWVGEWKLTGKPHPAGIPSAAIALHGASSYFSRPAVESVSVAPHYLNTVDVPSSGTAPVVTNPKKSAIQTSVTLTMKPARVDLWMDDYATSIATFSPVVDPGSRIVQDTCTFPSNQLFHDGTYRLLARGVLATGVASDPEADTFIVDNTAPDVGLSQQQTTAPISGNYLVQGRVREANLKEWQVKWRYLNDPAEDWKGPILSDKREKPLVGSLGVLDTRALGWCAPVELRLEAVDMAGNQGFAKTTITTFNDVLPPGLTVTRADAGPALANKVIIRDMIPLTLTTFEDQPSQTVNTGLKSVKFWIENEQNADDNIQLYSKDNFTTADHWRLTQTPIILNTYDLKRVTGAETWRLVAQSTDKAGNTSTSETKGLIVGNALKSFDAYGASFQPIDKNYQHHTTNIASRWFRNDIDWTATLRPHGKSDIIRTWTGRGDSDYIWDGTDSSSPTPTAVPYGLYDATLTFNDAGPHSVTVSVAVLRPQNAIPYISDLEALRASDDFTTHGAQKHFDPPVGSGMTRGNGNEFIATSQFPIVRILAKPGDEVSMKPYLDGVSRPGTGYHNRYSDDAWWALEFKSTETFPQETDLNNPNGLSIMDDTNWNLVKWGNGWPGAITRQDGNYSVPEGTIEAFWDTSKLPEGYYDVRLWLTDGKQPVQEIVFYLKVVRSSTTPPDGGPNEIGSMTLSATDMTVPFNGYTAQVSRSYDSSDIYNPGILGYGWRMNGLNLEIEHAHAQGAGEYEEANIRLPDGRKFFFANNPPDTGFGALTENQWVVSGQYMQRPYGMRLYRPGGSTLYNNEDYSPQGLLPQLLPGSSDRMQVEYTRGNVHYGPGQVAYLQTEDKSWYIFEWSSGKLIEIIRTDGQRVEFTKETQYTTNITDTSNRLVKMELNALDLLTTMTDPTGHKVSFEYDKYKNLTTVTDRSGRKRFYLYDTPEMKKKYPADPRYTGLGYHLLVDVRVDDDLSEGHRVPLFAEDKVPNDITETNEAFLKEQNWPGDISILKVSYEGGLAKRYESYAGSVSLDHKFNDNGSGSETVSNDSTGVKVVIDYDEYHRPKIQHDFWNNPTAYVYDDTIGDQKISGVLQSETDALRHVTQYDYPTIPKPTYHSFADMFEHYITDSVVQSDRDMPGYLTGDQAQPSVINKKDENGDVLASTQITYDMEADSKTAFQPMHFDAPDGSKGDLNYDSDTGKLTTITVMAVHDNQTTVGPKTENYYYTSADGVAPGLIGRLKQTTTYPVGNSMANARTTRYTYQLNMGANGEVEEVRTTTDLSTGLSSSSSYDSSDNLKSSTNSQGTAVSATTDGEGRITYAQDEQGNSVYSYFNVLGQKTVERLSKVSITGTGGPYNIYTRYKYDDAGHAVEVRRLAEDKDALSTTTNEYAYNASGRIETTHDGSGLGSRRYYDGGGRLIRSEQLDVYNHTMSSVDYQYDELGRKKSDFNSRGVTTTYSYDALGRVTATQVSGPGVNTITETGYDDAGRQLWTSSPTENGGRIYTRFQYDMLGRLTRTFYDCPNLNIDEDTWTSVTRTEYDEQGRRAVTWDEEGVATRYFYNTLGQSIGTTLGWKSAVDPGIFFGFTPDNQGHFTQITNPTGQTRIKFYDNKGRLVREYGHKCDQSTSSLGIGRQVTEYHYYDNGQLHWKKEGTVSPDWFYTSGNIPYVTDPVWTRTTSYHYDPYTDRLVQEDQPDGATVTYDYRKSDGQLQRIDTKTSTGLLSHWKLFDYDSRTGKLSMMSSPEGKITYSYHDDGSLASISTGTGQENRYFYDAMGRIEKIYSTSLADSGQKAVTYTYDPATGRKNTVTYPNGITASYSYVPRGWLACIKYSGATDLLRLNYLRDKRGLVTSTIETRTGEAPGTTTWSYTYDSLKRLTRAQGLGPGASPTDGSIIYAYTYDADGNRVSQTITEGGVQAQFTRYTYNSLDQLIHEYPTGGSAKTYAYDAFGNQVSESTSGGDVRTYSWNCKNRLISAHIADGNKSLTYGYDESGLRISRLLQVPGSPDEETRYVTDGSNPSGYSQTLEETDASGTPSAEYAWGTDGLLAQKIGLDSGVGGGFGTTNAGGTLAFLHADNLGSTKLLTTATGAPIPGSAYGYEPFGTLTTANTTDATLSPYKFTGQFADDQLWMQYHRARWLNTGLGYWSSSDPVWDWPGNLGNSYSYAGENPISGTDQSGQFELVEIVAVSAIMGTIATPAMDIYLNGYKGLKHTAKMAGIGLIAGLLIGLLIAGAGLALMTAFGMTVGEAMTVIGILMAPVNIAMAASTAHKLSGTESGRRAGMVILILALIGALLAPFGAVAEAAEETAAVETMESLATRVLPFKPSILPAVEAVPQSLDDTIEVYQYSQYPFPRSLNGVGPGVPSGSGSEAGRWWSLIPPDVMKNAKNVVKYLDPPGAIENPDLPYQYVYRGTIPAGSRIQAGTVPRGLNTPQAGGYATEIINLDTNVDWDYIGILPL